jgi:hypothetical protein
MVSVRKLIAVAVAAIVFMLAAISASSASAAFGIVPGSVAADVIGPSGEVMPQSQAGSHPFGFRVNFSLNTIPNPFEHGEVVPSAPEPIPDGSLRDLNLQLPPGLVGRASSFPQCTAVEFAPVGLIGTASCLTASQIGIARVPVGLVPGYKSVQDVPVYNLAAPDGVVARIGFTMDVPIVVDFKVRTGSDYGVSALVRNAAQAVNVYSSSITLWGVPSDPRHDAQRYLPGAFAPGDAQGDPLPSGGGQSPFLDMPTRCNVPMTTHLEVNSWQDPGTFLGADAPAQSFSGCDRFSFAPQFNVALGGSRAGAPTGLSVALRVPQSDSPDGLITPPFKDVDVELPAGMAINPSSANGLSGCSLQEIELGGESAPSCPASSKIGTVQVTTPLLSHPLKGSVYLAAQRSNPFGSLFALYLVLVDPESGLVVKLPGEITANSETGQLRTVFSDNPQLPIESLEVALKGGDNAPLLAPAHCGTYSARATLTDWANPDAVVQRSSSFAITEGCADDSRFEPALAAGTLDPSAGAFSSFQLRLTQASGEQNLSRISATLPPGLLAKLKGIPLCGDAQADSGNCPAGSVVGTTMVGAGAGSNPIYVPEPGKSPTAVYLAGPYGGAPYSLVVKVPAQAGPFDLGTVVVRNALRIDPTTTQVTAESDPLPQILQGIPISYRDVRVEITRPEFTLNPTSCSQFAVTSLLTSSDGQTASPRAPFAAANCGRLAFKPKLNLKVSGGTKRGTYPKLRAELTAKPGEANIGRVSVALPHSEFLAQEHIKTICTRVQFAADQCPAGSIYGFAKATTPLLDQPLEGPVYLRSSSNPLPDLVAALHGAIDVDLSGRIDSVNGGIRTTFDAVPDAQVSKFALEMKGGKKSLLVNSRNLCAGVNRASVKMEGQNGKAHDFNPVLGSNCGKGRKKGKRR